MYKLVRPLFFLFDSETAHALFMKVGIVLARSPLQPLISLIYNVRSPVLETTVFGLKFKNPVGLAAGFDKNGEISEFLPALSFGFTEIGTVTPLPQPGNPKPRLFRLVRDRALINSMGFNNNGASAMAALLRRQRNTMPIGINIGKNKTTPIEAAAQDYEKAFIALAGVASYIAINVSSPNTPNLRELQDKEPLTALITRLQSLNQKLAKPVPLLLKIAPDLTEEQLDEIVVIAEETKLNGIIACNTTVNHNRGQGGLSGEPLKKRAREVISHLYKKSEGKIPLIGVGGIASARDAYEMIQCGASLVQIYTGMIYEGPGLAASINKGLVKLLRRDGYNSVQQAVGSAS